MKHNYNAIKGLFTAMLLLLLSGSFAQVNISVQVLPPFKYRITDYASHPEQLLVTVINTSATAQRVQLRGSVTGDNGISITVRPTSKTKTPLLLSPGQAQVLNGNDMISFLDVGNAIFTGITPEEALRQNGLPEGNYRLCIRAYNYDTNAPLSPDQPIGCSNIFSITNIEPPRIINPYDGQPVGSNTIQTLNLSWSTPPGAPPSTMYRIKMVEVVGATNPNTAMTNAPRPAFFEKEVMGNMYIYGPTDPRLVEGRKYAMMVQAFDPNQVINFRNNGQSTVISFTYTTPYVLKANDTVKTGTRSIDDTYAEKPTLMGQVLGAFPDSETGMASGKQVLVSTTAIAESANISEVASVPGTKLFPMPGAFVGVFEEVGNNLNMITGTTTDALGRYSSKVPVFINPKNKVFIIITPSGNSSSFNTFKSIRRYVKYVPTIRNGKTYYDTNFGTDVVVLNAMRLTANVVSPSLDDVGKLQVNLLLDARTWNFYPFMKAAAADPNPEHVLYNGNDYLKVATLTTGNEYKGFYYNFADAWGRPGTGINYLVEVKAENKPAVYYPLASAPNQYYESRWNYVTDMNVYAGFKNYVVNIKKNFTYNFVSTLSGIVTYNKNGRSGVKVTATVKKEDVTGSTTALTFNAISDYWGNYSITLPALKKGVVVSISVDDQTIQQTPFTYTANYDGASIVKNLEMVRKMDNIIGRLVDNNGLPVQNANVTVAGTSISTKTNADGLYFLRVAAPFTGDLQFTADNYEPGTLAVTDNNKLGTTTMAAADWKTTLNATVAAKQLRASGLTADDLGIGTGDLATVYQTYFGPSDLMLNVIGPATVTLKNLRGTINMTVKLNNKAVKAKIKINGAGNDLDLPTDKPWLYMNTPAYYTFTITPYPGEQQFVTYYGDFYLDKGSYKDVAVLLDEGVKVSGKVTDSQTTALLDSANISISGKPYKVTTSNTGEYVLYLPKNQEFTMNAARKKYYGKDTTVKFTAATNLDILLKSTDVTIPVMTSMAGFPISLTKQVLAGNNSYTISGSLILAANALYQPVAGYEKLNFKNVTVKMGGDKGNVIPLNDVTFDEALLQVKALGYAQVEVQGSPQIQMKAGVGNDYTKAVIGGNQLVLKIKTGANAASLPVPLNDAAMKDKDALASVFNAVFSAPGATLPELSDTKTFALKFLPANYNYSGTISFAKSADPKTYIESKVGDISSLYVQTDSASLSKDGVYLNGYFQFPEIKFTKADNGGKIKIKRFFLKPDYSFKEATMDVTDTSPFQITLQKIQASFTKVQITGLGTANPGLDLGGKFFLKKKKPNENATDGALTIKSLTIVNKADGKTLSGTLMMDEGGLAIKTLLFKASGDGLVDFSSNANGYTFSTAGTLSYTGSGTDATSKSIIGSVFPIKIANFQLNTIDWGTTLAIAPNLTINYGNFAKLKVDRFLLNSGYAITGDQMNDYMVKGVPFTTPVGNADEPVDDSKLSFAMGIAGSVEITDDVQAKGGGSILVAYTNDKLDIRVNELSIKVDNPSMQVEGKVKMSFQGDKQGLEGDVNMTLMGTSLAAGFKYYKYQNGTYQIGGNIKAATRIFTGPILWYALGGGFDFDTNKKTYSVNLTGDAGILGMTQQMAYLKDINFNVLYDIGNCGSSPIIDGSANLMMKGASWGKMTAKMDFCKKMLLVNVNGQVPLMSGVNVGVNGVLYGMAGQDSSPGSGTMFLGANINVTTLGDIVNGNAFVALGINYDNSSADAPADAKALFANINSSAFPGTVLNAVYIKGNINVPEKDSEFKIKISSFDLFRFHFDFQGSGNTEIYYNYNNNQFYASAAVAFYANANIYVLGLGLNADGYAKINVAGGYNGNWYLGGKVALGFSFYNDAGTNCNSTRLIGKDVCANLWYLCGWEFWTRDAWCSKQICVDVPWVGFKVCSSLSASFNYVQNQSTSFSFDAF